ncbi:MAG: DegV family protein [Clostridia bacterium]|nr:DegV family protein [Clostridia bacterium]
MNNYRILTDSSCDLTPALAASLELTVLPLSVTIGEDTYANYLDEREITFRDCYDALRAGKPSKTSAANVDAFLQVMDPILAAGEDILYLGFSSGLSGTYNAGCIAAEQMREKYPERKIYCVDTLAASLGQGLLIYLTVEKKRAGATVEQARDFAEETKLHVAHWFTVDDLNHLRRGGRVSATSAVLGTMLSIKPVLHMDDEGHLIFMEKVRGRKTSIKRMLEKMRESVVNPDGQTVFISHGDCIEEAEYLAARVREEWAVKDVIINYVGPVIGAHAGPGVIALFFLGTKR